MTRAEDIHRDTGVDLAFCELDSDLQPWSGKPQSRQRKEPLATLYERARIWVFSDFRMKHPAQPADWSFEAP